MSVASVGEPMLGTATGEAGMAAAAGGAIGGRDADGASAGGAAVPRTPTVGLAGAVECDSVPWCEPGLPVDPPVRDSVRGASACEVARVCRLDRRAAGALFEG